MRRRMGDNALQNKPPCRITGSKKGVRFNVTPPYAQSRHRPSCHPILALQPLIKRMVRGCLANKNQTVAFRISLNLFPQTQTIRTRQRLPPLPANHLLDFKFHALRHFSGIVFNSRTARIVGESVVAMCDSSTFKIATSTSSCSCAQALMEAGRVRDMFMLMYLMFVVFVKLEISCSNT